MKRALLACIGLLLLAPAALAQPAPRGADTGAARSVGRELKEAVLRAELGRFWGAVLVVRRGEVLLAEGFGLANEQLDPIGPDHLFDMGSVTKMFTAAAILRLEQDGRLSTEDPLSKFFPDAGEGAETITLKHLMAHTSGKSDRARAIQHLGFNDRDEAVRRFVKSRSAGAPGEQFEYCNGGYVVLGAVLEKAAGKTYEQAVRALVLEPAGMKSSGFLDGAGLDASKQTVRITSGRMGDRRGLMLDKTVEPWAWGLKGAGGLVTSVNDLVAFERALRSRTILGESSHTKWTTPVLDRYALGWMVSTDEEGRTVHRHGGATRGYRCDLVHYPQEQVFIAVMMGESGMGPTEMADLLAKVVMPPEPANMTAVMSFEGETLSKYKAVEVESGAVLKVERDAGGGATLRFGRAEPERTLATFTMDAGATKKLARTIRATLDSGQHKAAKDGGVKGGLYLYQYADDVKAGTLTIENAAWMVMPGYSGRGENGESITDPRVVLALTDPNHEGGWCAMVHVDDDTAERLVRELSGN
ncbi:MAG TPA: serine hydrolase domain-containing protein [Phycisphaerales bacterium]|nr:serine hydrolase domain-containing protein [Phycisphaerales bacterium]